MHVTANLQFCRGSKFYPSKVDQRISIFGPISPDRHCLPDPNFNFHLEKRKKKKSSRANQSSSRVNTAAVANCTKVSWYISRWFGVLRSQGYFSSGILRYD